MFQTFLWSVELMCLSNVYGCMCNVGWPFSFSSYFWGSWVLIDGSFVLMSFFFFFSLTKLGRCERCCLRWFITGFMENECCRCFISWYSYMERSCGFFVWWNDEILHCEPMMEWWGFDHLDHDGIYRQANLPCDATYYQDGNVLWSFKWPKTHCCIIESKYTVSALIRKSLSYAFVPCYWIFESYHIKELLMVVGRFCSRPYTIHPWTRLNKATIKMFCWALFIKNLFLNMKTRQFDSVSHVTPIETDCFGEIWKHENMLYVTFLNGSPHYIPNVHYTLYISISRACSLSLFLPMTLT